MHITAGEFKAKCLKLMDRVQKSQLQVIITKYGKPVAKLVPLSSREQKALYGLMKGSVVIHSDIVSSTGEIWDVER